MIKDDTTDFTIPESLTEWMKPDTAIVVSSIQTYKWVFDIKMFRCDELVVI